MQETADTLVEYFQSFPSWNERYAFLIDLGRGLQHFPEEQRTEEHRLYGCQASVWLSSRCEDGRIHFSGVSDSLIVSGLMAMLFKVFSGQMANEVAQSDLAFMEKMDLMQHLSHQRATGLAAMVTAMREAAAACALQQA